MVKIRDFEDFLCQSEATLYNKGLTKIATKVHENYELILRKELPKGEYL